MQVLCKHVLRLRGATITRHSAQDEDNFRIDTKSNMRRKTDACVLEKDEHHLAESANSIDATSSSTTVILWLVVFLWIDS